VPLFVENAPAIAEMSIRRGISVILDLSDYDQKEMQAILLAYLKHLWDISTEVKKPYGMVIEEAHEFAPQGRDAPLKEIITRYMSRGRKAASPSLCPECPGSHPCP
jgi:DNA helicase HerA-like ATPase